MVVGYICARTYLSPNIPFEGFELHLIVQGPLNSTGPRLALTGHDHTVTPSLVLYFCKQEFSLFLTRNARKKTIQLTKATCTLMQNHIHPHQLKLIVPTRLPIHLAFISDVLDCPRHRRTLQAPSPRPTHRDVGAVERFDPCAL